MKRHGQRVAGFSMIELLLVLVILGVLVGIVVTRFTGRGEQARVTAARADIRSLETALDAFEIDNGRFPTTQEGLEALVERPSNAPNWNRYLSRGVPTDPWGNPYVYEYPGRYNDDGYDLYSEGPEGGDGERIGNW
ncbi:type II secretion system major pseudopilin GspG [Phycisphaerales bacterium AB-hyl4]|uniref:Type II secretion system core protein G n=1 Tax=Natronomicrosphaera hydrolytica TaxID=3242702 RepID=A0ABV4TZH3_9BACT